MNSLKKRWYLLVLALLIVASTAFSPTDKYFEIVRNLDIFATLYKEVNAYYVDEVNPSTLMTTGIEAMLESLDPYTNYIAEDDIEDYRTHMTGQYGGIGCVIGNREEKCLVLMPYDGFPAQKAGLTIGDEIVSIDGIAIKSKNTGDISKLLKGQAGTPVKISVIKVGTSSPIELTLQRERIKIDNVPYSGMVSPETGLIKLSEFTANATKDVQKAVHDLKQKGAKSIVIDLRGNPGGLLSEAIGISNLFVPKDKLIVSTKGKIAEWNKEYFGTEIPEDIEIPIVVLINSRSASASEIVSGVIQDYDRGVIVGQRSFGKGLVQATRPLSYNSQLKITTAKYYTPSGRCIQAIDYSNRNEDGSVGKIPDSLQHNFTTANGRLVRDGGGVKPDVEVEKESVPSVIIGLVNKNLLFDYGTLYYIKHTSIPFAREFTLTDDEYADFVKWLENKDYEYSTQIEKTLAELEQESKDEKYYDAIKVQLEAFKEQIQHSKQKDLITFKSDIKRVLEEEIISRYYLQKGLIEASFKYDKELNAALKVLEAPSDYKKILTGK
ncbi:MAG: prc [Chitinophagaceae bacterium]|nr:prc [Chitinophagaceae bacterium]